MHTKIIIGAICLVLSANACAASSSETSISMSQPLSTSDPRPPLVHQFSSSGNCQNYRFHIAGSHVRTHPEGWRSKSEIDSLSIWHKEQKISVPSDFLTLPSTDKIIEVIPECAEGTDFLTISILLKRTKRTDTALGYGFLLKTITFSGTELSKSYEETLTSDQVLAVLD
ncbi:hypothetical protein [Parvularcula marina]|uniref:hypothetical protein n=1 Tax=Parvularcula marina TaxID=2292771 RepID=UPI0011C0704D|nr:hypothetical protein [Parvularcula marina]